MTALLAHEVRWDLIGMFRNKRARFFTLAFPLLLLVILVGISRGGTATVDGDETTLRQFFVAGILALSLLSACYAALVGTVVSEREYGALKRRRATPVPAWIVVAGQAIATLAVAALSTVILLVVARVLYGVRTPAGGLAIVALAVVAGGLAFACVAYAVAALIPNVDAAQPAVQLTMLPLYFISGIWFPTDELPGTLQTIAHLLPVEPLAHILHLAFLNASVDGSDLLVVGVWALIGLVVATKRFSWLPREAVAT
jgi:ABC-2 type transport system permease protein